MKKNYLKPLCMTTPMRVQRLMEGSIKIDKSNVVTNSTDAGWSRETSNYDDSGAVSPRSVWDD